MSPNLDNSTFDNTGLDDARITTFGLLVEAHAHMEAVFGRSLDQAHGLPLSSFEAILRLGRSPDQQLTMGELTEQITLTSGGVTRLVDRLIASGLVERIADPADRRVQRVRLTQAGQTALNAAVKTHLVDLEAELFGRITATEAATLAHILAKLR